MKKSLLALAVLGAFAGAASAQSSVTVYGKLNAEVGKTFGSANKDMMDVAGSRLGFKGVEDLGGGLSATFGIEHRFNPATGAANANFWNGYSTAGLQGAFGHVRIGRDYTPAFLMIQNQIDPFGGDTQGQLRDVAMRVGDQTGTTRITTVRNAAMLEYHFSASGFNLGAQIAETPAGGTNRPYSVAANYAAGPLFVGAGIENPTGANDSQWNIGGRYNLGFMTASFGYTKGTTNANVSAKGWLLGANIPVGQADIKVAYGVNDLANVAGKFTKLGLGVHYNLSKRTKVFADFGRIGGDERSALQKAESNGYDLGVQHNF